MAIALVGLICTIPLGVTAQEGASWDVYEVTWLDYNYHNLTTISIKHPVDGSLVSGNQRLNFIVVPFDQQDLFYEVKVYKNDILMYTINQERVYDINIFTTNAINQIVTIKFMLNDNIEILSLEYLAILSEPSLDRDWTDLFLQYQAEKMNETISGRDVITARDKAVSDMNLVATTGFWALLLAGVAIFFVLTFRLISVLNGFSGIVWFGSAYIGIDTITKLDANMATLEIVTPDDVYVYYAKMITTILIIGIANLFYLISYKATSTRLNRQKFPAVDKKNRKIINHEAVIGRQRGTGLPVWIIQDTISAIRRVIWKADYVIDYGGIGDLNDAYYEQDAKHIPENISSKKPYRDLKRAILAINRRKEKEQSNNIFHADETPKETDDNEILDEMEKDQETQGDSKKKVKFKAVAGKKEKKPKVKKEDETDKQLKETKEKAKDYTIWREIENRNPLAGEIPIVFLDGHPEFKEVMDAKEHDDFIEQMKQELADATDPKIIKDIKKRIKKTDKLRKKPKAYKVNIRLANRNIYDLMDWLTDAGYYDRMGKALDRLWHENHKLKIERDLKSIEQADTIMSEFDNRLEQFENMEVFGPGDKDDRF